MIKEKMNIEFVDLSRQYASIKPEIDAAISQVLEKTDFVNGKSVKTFQENFASFCGVKYCVPCGNGTDALEIGMKALGIGPGDEVIVPANSFVASSEAVNNIGAEVVFADVHPQTYNLDPASLNSLIHAKTKAIMVVHLYGRVSDMSQILELAKAHQLFVIEDASQAHGASFGQTKAGGFGDFGVFSFYPGKNLGAYGDAGALVTSNESLFMKAYKIANHGRIEKYNHELIGRNSRLDTLQAAVLNVKLPHLESWNSKRREIARQYHQRLAGIVGLVTPVDKPGESPVYHLYVVRVGGGMRDALQAFLKESGIATGIHYPIALHELEAYRYLGHKPEDFPVAHQLQNEILSLPIFAEMESEEIDYVCGKIFDFYNSK